MFKFLQYIIAYFSLVILWICILLTFLSFFDYIEMKGSLLFIIILSGTIYHKLKPMDFKDLLEKIGITL